ncbi:MAG: bifunctional adenosylcobinamide kinase/adenosylcobinamide-phosphate guanylyltransferase [Barnesiella sp.]|nr:bifunctional adenosylcobinamide kinase/adenosylcobinamide-phosphate guanylyltransferase [Barnesiella sp.]
MNDAVYTNNPKLIMVTGGQRSGKSVFAENLALSMSHRPVYLATARIYDEEMRRRVELHRERRHERWTNLESPLFVSEAKLSSSDVVLLDCLTLLATNWFFECQENAYEAFAEIRRQIDALLHNCASLIVVTNEIGLGGISANAMQRQFADLQGRINQHVATEADEVYLLISGIPVKIKPQQ